MKRVTLDEIKQRIIDRFPEERFEVIEYNGTGQPGKIKCLQCGNIIEVNKFSNFFAKNKAYGCKECHGLWRDRENKIEKIKQFYDIVYTYVKNTHTYYHVRCKECGHERDTSLNNLMAHLDCGCKTNVLRNRTAQEFIDEANRYYNNELALMSDYIDQIHKVLLRHLPCGLIWEVRPADIIHGRSHCPKCRTKESAGEQKIKNILDSFNIKYFQQYPLKDSRQLFDFFLPDYNLTIEYNGRQHYEYIPFFHKTQDGFKNQLERDEKKRLYCKQNNISLLEISYKQDNDIEEIIKNKISSTTKIGQVPEKATLPKMKYKGR